VIFVGPGNWNGFPGSVSARDRAEGSSNPTYVPTACLQLAVISAMGRSVMSGYRKTNPSKPGAMRRGRMSSALQAFITICPFGNRRLASSSAETPACFVPTC
jgi:hypothetical protein